MSATTTISLVTLEQIACYLTKDWIEAFNNLKGKNHGGETHKKDITVEDKMTLE